jgi:hypothetical protein
MQCKYISQALHQAYKKHNAKHEAKLGIIYTNSCVLKTYKYKQQSKGVNMDL